MFNYAQYLQRATTGMETVIAAIADAPTKASHQFLPSYDKADVDMFAMDAQVDIGVTAADALDTYTKKHFGLIAYGFAQQSKHTVEQYSDYELQAFNYRRAEGFNCQEMFTLVTDQYWGDEDIQIIIENARLTMVDDTLIATIDNIAGAFAAAETACADPAACTDAENAANLTARKNLIQAQRMPDMYLRIMASIQDHKINYPVQDSEALADNAFIRIADSTNEKVSLSYGITAKSNILAYGINLEDIVKEYLSKDDIVVILNEADSVATIVKDQAADHDNNVVAYKALTEPELMTLRQEKKDPTFSQAKFSCFDGLTGAACLTPVERLWRSGIIALRRFKSDASNANPNRTYSDYDLELYGMTEELLVYRQWSAEQPQFVMSKAAKIKMPLTLGQENQLKTDYEKTETEGRLQYKAADAPAWSFDLYTSSEL